MQDECFPLEDGVAKHSSNLLDSRDQVGERSILATRFISEISQGLDDFRKKSFKSTECPVCDFFGLEHSAGGQGVRMYSVILCLPHNRRGHMISTGVLLTEEGKISTAHMVHTSPHTWVECSLF